MLTLCACVACFVSAHQQTNSNSNFHQKLRHSTVLDPVFGLDASLVEEDEPHPTYTRHRKLRQTSHHHHHDHNDEDGRELESNGGMHCYKVDVAGKELCCSSKYDGENGFPSDAVCYLPDRPKCSDVSKCKFTDGDLAGKKCFKTVTTGASFKIDNDPYQGSKKGYNYVFKSGSQNNVKTELMDGKSQDTGSSIYVNAVNNHEIDVEFKTNEAAVIMKAGTGGLIYLRDGDKMSGLLTPVGSNGQNKQTSKF